MARQQLSQAEEEFQQLLKTKVEAAGQGAETKKAAPAKKAAPPAEEPVEKPARKVTRAVKAAGKPVKKTAPKKAAPPAEEPVAVEPEEVVEEAVPPVEEPVAVETVEEEAPPAQQVVSPAPRVVGRHPIEDPGLSEGMLGATAFGSRYHQRFLGNMYGAFLTLLDSQGRILFFVAGALRCRTSEDEDTVFYLDTIDILQGAMGAGKEDGRPFQPEVRTVVLKGDARRGGHEVKFREIPALTRYLAASIPEAARWGLLSVGVSPTKRMQGGVPNGENSEVYLHSRSWKVDDKMGPVPGSSTRSLADRLAPRAIEFAQARPSAWLLAMTGAALFGGMTVLPRAAVPASVALSGLIRSETELRAEKVRQLREARLRRERGAVIGTDLGAVLDGATLDAAMASAPTSPPQ